MTEHDDGEQGPDTDGLAKYLVVDGHEDDQPRRMPSDVATALDTSTDVLVSDETWNGVKALVLARDDRIAELQARIARKEAANEALVQRVFALEAKQGATLADMRSLQTQLAMERGENEALKRLAEESQAEAQRLSDLLVKAEEERARPVTDSEQAAEQMRQDILGGKIDRAGRQVVRDACDRMDAPKTGRDASNDALGRISGRGGVMSGWGR